MAESYGISKNETMKQRIHIYKEEEKRQMEKLKSWNSPLSQKKKRRLKMNEKNNRDGKFNSNRQSG